MNSSDEKLNQLLNSVAPRSPSSNLAQRIIAQAEIPDINVNKESFFKQVLRSLIFPKPAYALACSMLVGVLLGWQNPDVNINTIQVISADEELGSLFLAEVNFDE